MSDYSSGPRTAEQQRASDAEDDARLAIFRLALGGHTPEAMAALIGRAEAYVLETLADFLVHRVLVRDAKTGGFRQVRDHENPSTKPKSRTRAESQGRMVQRS